MLHVQIAAARFMPVIEHFGLDKWRSQNEMTKRYWKSTKDIFLVFLLTYLLTINIVTVTKSGFCTRWSGVVVLINEVKLHQVGLVLGWVTVFGFNSRCGTVICVFGGDTGVFPPALGSDESKGRYGSCVIPLLHMGHICAL